MELLRGRAAHVAATSIVKSSGSGDSLSVYTEHLNSFSLAGREVRLSGSNPPVVRDGDDVVIVGEADHAGIIEPVAYINVTRGVGSASQGPTLWKIGGVIVMGISILGVMIGAGMLAISSVAGKPAPDDLLLGAAIIVGYGVLFFAGRWLYQRGRKIALALRMIHDASKQAAAART